MRPQLVLVCSLTASILLFPLAPARAQGFKRADIPGYALSQLTANGSDDSQPRVSASGLVVWTGRYNLPGATSVATDNEVFLWDGATLTQITDDGIDQVRPVVNDFGDMAWQVGDGSPTTEIWALVDGVLTQVTDDSAGPGVIDRYPDLNNAGILVWGRLLPTDYFVCVWDSLVGGAFSVIGRGYRPHISSASHMHAAGVNGIFDTAYQFVVPMGAPSTFGYREFRRSEINDLDQLAIEAERPGTGPLLADFTGPRDILFWDGATMHTIFRSPGPWHGRADLNASGVIAWEGYGGLPGSVSGTADEEIFVYRPELRQVVQLTDDDAIDSWPTVTGDGRVIWMGTGDYPPTQGQQLDREIFQAVPNGDADGDGVADAADNCPLRANAGQDDHGGLVSPFGDGTGDACQCGDVSNDGRIALDDVDAFRTALSQGQIDSLPAPAKCRVNAGWAPCSVLDVVLMRRAVSSWAPGAPALPQTCDAALQF